LQEILAAQKQTWRSSRTKPGPARRSNPSGLCAATIDMFVSILASEAANLALKVFATGGVYLAGGIPMHALKALQAPRFMESFKRKGRLSELMELIPVHVVITRAAMIGAAACGLESLRH